MSDRLPNDIQRLVLDKVSSPRDHARFSSVCKLWYSIYKERTFPWAVLEDHDNENHTRGFFSVYDQKIYRFSAPELEEKKIRGSSHGWLVTIDNEHAFGLYNPFSKSFIQLPLSPFKEYNYHTNPDGPQINKVILSCNPHTNPDECIILLLNDNDNLEYCKIGDKSWSPISNMVHPIFTYFEEAIFHKGKFFVACPTQVYVCHMDSKPHLTPFGPELPLWTQPVYLVSLEGDVVIVSVNTPIYMWENPFDVYKLDKDMISWKKENEIGDRIIFLGRNESISLSTSLVPNSIANTIYFGLRRIFHLKKPRSILVDALDHLEPSPSLWLIQN